MRRWVMVVGAIVLAMTAGCGRAPESPQLPEASAAADAAPTEVADDTGTDIPEFPAIPMIVVPEIVGIGPAQRALETSMSDIIDPMAGISVRPANCATDGALVNDAGITSVDEQGNLVRNGDEGIFRLAADGSGTANYGGGIVTVNADGSGTINSSDEGGEGAVIRVEADGSGTYNGPYGVITLDGKGAGTWNGDHGIIRNNGDGSGSWNGPQGIVTIDGNGAGTWNGPAGIVVNNGDGTGRIGTPGREVRMPPLPDVAPAGRFPPLQKFAPPGAPCGFVITLNESVLFDFDRSDIRPDASKILDTLAVALGKVEARAVEIRGHTDAKGSDDYNQSLSERRARSVVDALHQRGVAQQAQARGYGESQPVAPNEIGGKDNPAGRQLNRRVEIFVRT